MTFLDLASDPDLMVKVLKLDRSALTLETQHLLLLLPGRVDKLDIDQTKVLISCHLTHQVDSVIVVGQEDKVFPSQPPGQGHHGLGHVQVDLEVRVDRNDGQQGQDGLHFVLHRLPVRRGDQKG